MRVMFSTIVHYSKSQMIIVLMMLVGNDGDGDNVCVIHCVVSKEERIKVIKGETITSIMLILLYYYFFTLKSNITKNFYLLQYRVYTAYHWDQTS